MPILDQKAVAGIRVAFAAGRHDQIAPGVRESSVTLGGVIEVAAWLVDPANNDAKGSAILRSAGNGVVSTAVDLLRSTCATSVDLPGAGKSELGSISELTEEDARWWEFIRRFSNESVRAGVCEARYARALAMSLHEMADNVRQHATNDGDAMPLCLAGWHVANRVAAFVVVDLGQGIRSSLQTNPDFGTIASDRVALVDVVRNGATRKRCNKFGDGYKTVVQNFVSRNGALAVRSGSAELIATGNVAQGSVNVRPCPSFAGTRVGAWCSPSVGALPDEPML